MIQWYYGISVLELIFCLLFVLGSALYVRRSLRIAKHFKSNPRRIFIKLGLRLVYFTLLILSILGPSFGYGKKLIQAIGKDIYVLLDLSASMNCQDIQPSRLERVKKELSTFFQAFESDRIGLIAFADEADLQSPLTYDKEALDMFVQSLDTDLFQNQGTDFYPALRLVLDRHSKIENKATDPYAKIVILISDGEDFGSEAMALLQEFQEKGIRVFTLGIGSIRGAKIPVKGQENRYMTDEEGKEVLSKLQYKNLSYIAEQSQGEFYEISSSNKNDMPQLIQDIKDIKGQPLDVRMIDVSYNKFTYFLWVALALICIDLIFVVKVVRI